MKDVEDTVIKCHQKILDDAGIKEMSNLNMKMSRENGIDSLGMVLLILGIEEELGINLDQYLAEIRRACYLQELINIIKKARDIQ